MSLPIYRGLMFFLSHFGNVPAVDRMIEWMIVLLVQVNQNGNTIAYIYYKTRIGL